MCYNSKLRGNFPHECTKRRWQQEKTLQDIRRNIWLVRTLVRDKTEHTQTHTHPPGRLMFAIMVIFRNLCQCQTPFIGKSEIKLKTQVQLLQLLLNISCSITSQSEITDAGDLNPVMVSFSFELPLGMRSLLLMFDNRNCSDKSEFVFNMMQSKQSQGGGQGWGCTSVTTVEWQYSVLQFHPSLQPSCFRLERRISGLDPSVDRLWTNSRLPSVDRFCTWSSMYRLQLLLSGCSATC